MAIDPARFGMPDATTTGVQPGTTLKPYTGPMTITTDGAVIENVIINGTLTVEETMSRSGTVSFQNFSTGGLNAANRPKAFVWNTATSLADGSTRTSAMPIGGGANAAVIGNDIHGMVIGIQLRMAPARSRTTTSMIWPTPAQTWLPVILTASRCSGRQGSDRAQYDPLPDPGGHRGYLHQDRIRLHQQCHGQKQSFDGRCVVYHVLGRHGERQHHQRLGSRTTTLNVGQVWLFLCDGQRPDHPQQCAMARGRKPDTLPDRFCRSHARCGQR